jgi:membrane protein required for colicin V production
MNVIDLGILVFVIFGLFFGWRKGFIMELFNFISLAAGVYFAFHFSDAVAKYFVNQEDGVMIPFIAFVFEKFVSFVWLSIFNKVLGGLIGALKWAFIASCALLFLGPLDPEKKAVSQKNIDSSKLYPIAIKFASSTMPGVKNTLLLSYERVQKEMKKPK